jgi:hypothetical protein
VLFVLWLHSSPSLTGSMAAVAARVQP